MSVDEINALCILCTRRRCIKPAVWEFYIQSQLDKSLGISECIVFQSVVWSPSHAAAPVVMHFTSTSKVCFTGAEGE